MQAMIMAAGKGSRIGHLTQHQPKCFLEIQGIKLIEYNIALLHHCGIHDITVVTGYMHAVLEPFLSKIQGVRTVYNPFYAQVNVIGSFYMAQHCLIEDCVYLHADTLCDPSIFKDMIVHEGDLVLPTHFKRCDEEAMKVCTHNQRITQISKQIDCEKAEGEFIGIAKLSKKIVPALQEATTQLMKQDQWQCYFEGAIELLLHDDTYHIVAMDIQNLFWGEIDFQEDYDAVCQTIPSDFVAMAQKFRGRDA